MYSRSSHPSGTDGCSPQCPWSMGQLVPIPWLRPRCIVAHQCARRDRRRDRSCRERCSFSRIPASLCPLSIRSRLQIQRRIDLLARVHTGSTDLPLWALRRDPGVRGMAVTLALQPRKEGQPELTTTFHVKHARCGVRGCSSPSQLS
jgi:hypothetical protein